MQLTLIFHSSNASYFIMSIHEKDQFMPGYSKLFGSNFVFEAAPIENKSALVDYILELTETTYLNRPESPCHPSDSTESYNPLSQCIKEHVEAKMKCMYVMNRAGYTGVIY